MTKRSITTTILAGALSALALTACTTQAPTPAPVPVTISATSEDCTGHGTTAVEVILTGEVPSRSLTSETNTVLVPVGAAGAETSTFTVVFQKGALMPATVTVDGHEVTIEAPTSCKGA